MSSRLFILPLCLLLAACSRLTQENYAQLSPGMSRAKVEALLGKPTQCSGALGLSSCTWGDTERYVSVQFAGDQVLLFSGKGLR